MSSTKDQTSILPRWFQRLIVAAILVVVTSFVTAAEHGPFFGRPVADVIEEFRAAGHPVAWSTNLVPPDLRVTVEPTAGKPEEILGQILEPHALALRFDRGVWLVVQAEGRDVGQLLFVLRARTNDSPIENADLTFVPTVPEGRRIAPGVYQYVGVRPARYRVDIEAAGFQAERRFIEVQPGVSTVENIGLEAKEPEIETITVAASRYEIARDIATSRFLLDRRSIQTMPDLGEDPLRAAQRLPGAAASGASAKTHFRGGEQGEIGIILNGQRLLDPFHVRDYQNVFSAIDSRAIDGIEVFTGGFPVRYGDRMSGVVLMETMEPERSRHTELGLSVYNTSALTAGAESGKRWLLSARRGNLDLIIDPQYGRPSYFDVFGEFAFEPTANTTMSVNALYADDTVTVVLESEPEELEQVSSNTRNSQLWLQLDSRWSDTLSMSTVISAVSYSNLRTGFTGDAEKIVSSVRDARDVSQYGLRQDWTWRPSDAHVLQWGMSLQRNDADYDYRVAAEYFGLPALYPDQPQSMARQRSASPGGGSYAAYLADRWKLSPGTIVEWGLRWDDQTYTGEYTDPQFSPRLSVLRKLGERTDLRLSWGRYQQSQGIHELQIEDDVVHFWPAQRADHFIAGLTHRAGQSTSWRIEAFHKRMTDVRPRFENLFDPLALIPEIQPDRVRLVATGAEAKGLEISVERTAGPWNWWTSYTWSEATDRIQGRDQPRSWDQRHAFQGGMSWSDRGWDLSLAANVHSGWPTTNLELVEEGLDEDGEPVYIAVPGPRNALGLGTFATVDLRISRQFELSKGRFTAFLEISNATNRRNECCVDWDLAEDGSGDELLERGLDYWLPLVPAVGVLWEF
jgi:outer membrane receptor protein involved in Fe transport